MKESFNPMRENDVLKIVRIYLATQFPKTCRNCGRQFDSFSTYLRSTTLVGKPISYDADRQDWQPDPQIGTGCLANCSCGNTLSLDSLEMERKTLWRLLRWARDESKAQEMGIGDLIARICHQALNK